ncbi:MAG TPA: hypothetical protein VLG49_00525 [Rhabdochlamydiaceae bacterium]|nr:hypothetical protein [Rhabdochlamydiaceae bacterium]
MNLIQSIKNHAWPALGTIGGIVVGAAVNLWEHRSIFFKNPCYAHALHPAFEAINNIREDQHKGPIFSSTFPVYTYPAICFTIWNLYKGNEESRKIAERRLNDLFIKTFINGALRTGISHMLRFISQQFLNERYVDISGHAMNQTLMTIHAVNSLQTFSNIGTPFQKKCYSYILLALSVTDFAWMYKTIAHCHSIIDVAAGVAIAASSFFAIKLLGI